MCQAVVRRLFNPSERCHVRKVARLLAQALRAPLLSGGTRSGLLPAPESRVLRKLLPRTRRKTVKLLRGIHREFIGACSPRAAESQQTVHLRDAFVYTGEAPFRGSRERKEIRLCWDNRRAPKRRTMAAESENTLRESQNASQAK